MTNKEVSSGGLTPLTEPPEPYVGCADRKECDYGVGNNHNYIGLCFNPGARGSNVCHLMRARGQCPRGFNKTTSGVVGAEVPRKIKYKLNAEMKPND